MRGRRQHAGSLAATGLLVAAALASPARAAQSPEPASGAAPTGSPTREEFQALRDEVTQLRALVPTQAHTMVDVEHQFANLWFAARERNWPLARFYFNETRGRIAWTVRIRPVRKLESGADLPLAPFVQNIEDVGFTPLKAAIEARDSRAVKVAYQRTLDACYACHKAVEKPQLKPEVPQHPGALLIRMQPEPGVQ